MCRAFLYLNTYLSFLSKPIRWLSIIVHQKSWKFAFKTGFTEHNINLYLWWQVENTKWILCSRKIGDKYEYLRFMMYKIYLLINYLFFQLLKSPITEKILSTRKITSFPKVKNDESQSVNFCTVLSLFSLLFNFFERERKKRRDNSLTHKQKGLSIWNKTLLKRP